MPNVIMSRKGQQMVQIVFCRCLHEPGRAPGRPYLRVISQSVGYNCNQTANRRRNDHSTTYVTAFNSPIIIRWPCPLGNTRIGPTGGLSARR